MNVLTKKYHEQISDGLDIGKLVFKKSVLHDDLNDLTERPDDTISRLTKEVKEKIDDIDFEIKVLNMKFKYKYKIDYYEYAKKDDYRLTTEK